MKKKILSLLVAVCLFVPCLFMMTACGKEDVYGKYTIQSVTIDETTMTRAQYEEITDASNLDDNENDCYWIFVQNTTIELKEDGTFTLSFDEEGTEPTSANGNWTKDGDNLKLCIDGSDESLYDATLKDGKLTIATEASTIVLSK